MRTFIGIWIVLLLVTVISQSNKHVKFKTVTLQKVISLGNYESQRLEITAEVDTDCEDELHDNLLELNCIVSDYLAEFKQDHEAARAMDAAEKKKQTTFISKLHDYPPCPICDGVGYFDGDFPDYCDNCNGSGRLIPDTYVSLFA